WRRGVLLLPVFLDWFSPGGQNALNLVDVGIVDPFSAAITAAEAVEHMLPHDAGRLEAPIPRAATHELPAKPPLAGKLLRAQKPALARLGVLVSPFNLDRAHTGSF